tara:strand:- start:392 stop:739 length:348 start_codon:yes stop_codon:yes gene_type:complete
MENTEKQSEKMTEKQSEWKNRELGALWVRAGKSQKYLSGQIKMETMPGVEETIKVVVFTNKGKEKNERAPDYVVYRSEDADAKKAQVEKVASEATKEVVPESKTDVNEDIPEELF